MCVTQKCVGGRGGREVWLCERKICVEEGEMNSEGGDMHVCKYFVCCCH